MEPFLKALVLKKGEEEPCIVGSCRLCPPSLPLPFAVALHRFAAALARARVYPEKKFLAGQSTTIKANFCGDHFYNRHAIIMLERGMTDTEKELIISPNFA